MYVMKWTNPATRVVRSLINGINADQILMMDRILISSGIVAQTLTILHVPSMVTFILDFTAACAVSIRTVLI